MKKLFFTALIAIAVATSAFATDATKINVRVLNSFKGDFKTASNVSWTLKTNFAKVNFDIDGQKFDAFYDLDGSLIGSSHHIDLDELPVSAKRVFAKKYAGYTVKEAIQFDGVDESAFYISAQNEKETVILKVNNDSNVSIFKKTKR